MHLNPVSRTVLRTEGISGKLQRPSVYLTEPQDVTDLTEALYHFVNTVRHRRLQRLTSKIVPNTPGLRVSFGPGGYQSVPFDPQSKVNTL